MSTSLHKFLSNRISLLLGKLTELRGLKSRVEEALYKTELHETARIDDLKAMISITEADMALVTSMIDSYALIPFSDYQE